MHKQREFMEVSDEIKKHKGGSKHANRFNEGYNGASEPEIAPGENNYVEIKTHPLDLPEQKKSPEEEKKEMRIEEEEKK